MPRERNGDGATFRYVKAREYLLEYIVSNELQDGDLLPSMRDLASVLFDGNLKPVRTATEMLVEAGVLESQRGRGVFVRDGNAARAMVGDSATDTATPRAAAEDIALPYMLSTTRPTLHVQLAERGASFRNAWSSVAERYNARSEVATVELTFCDPPGPDGRVDGAIMPDILQVQVFRLQPLVEAGLVQDLSPLGLDLSRYYPVALEPVQQGNQVLGLPASAVTYCAILNERALGSKTPAIPDSWESIAHYTDFLLELADGLDRKQADAAVYSRFSFFFYLTLAGLFSGDLQAGVPRFKSPAVMDFTRAFGDAYCRQDCYQRPDAHDDDQAARTRSVIWETHTYDIPPAPSATGALPHYLPMPTNPQGHIPVVPHYLCISARTVFPDACADFMQFVAADAQLKMLAERGVLVPHAGTVSASSPVLHAALKSGRCVLKSPSSNQPDGQLMQVIDSLLMRWRRGEIPLEQACSEIDSRTGV